MKRRRFDFFFRASHGGVVFEEIQIPLKQGDSDTGERKEIDSLKLKVKAPENGWLEDDPFLLGWPIFSYVSGSYLQLGSSSWSKSEQALRAMGALLPSSLGRV